jgi:hypothetical protein
MGDQKSEGLSSLRNEAARRNFSASLFFRHFRNASNRASRHPRELTGFLNLLGKLVFAEGAMRFSKLVQPPLEPAIADVREALAIFPHSYGGLNAPIS